MIHVKSFFNFLQVLVFIVYYCLIKHSTDLNTSKIVQGKCCTFVNFLGACGRNSLLGL
jgi:hypothetical protein